MDDAANADRMGGGRGTRAPARLGDVIRRLPSLRSGPWPACLASSSRLPRRRLPLLPVCLFLCAAVRAEMIYVDPAAPGPARDGYTWATAYAGIQEAVRVAQPGDVVAVAQGSYEDEIVLKPGVWVRGGYGGFANPDAPPDVNARPSVVSGLGIGPVIYADATASGAGVEGLHLVPANYGTDAVFCNQSSPVIRGNIIRQARSGVSCGAGAAPLVEGNVINDCTNGVYCTGSSPTVAGNLITQSLYGIHTGKGSSPVIVSNTIADNDTGLDLFTGTPDIRNNAVSRNGTGVYLSGGVPFFSHNSLGGNVVDFDGLDDPAGANGNLSTEPRFLDPDNGDYHLAPRSPCIDAGDDAAPSLPKQDLDGRPRLHGAHVDIGAYEFGLPDATVPDALRIAAGLRAASGQDVSAMDLLPPAGIDILDAVRLNLR